MKRRKSIRLYMTVAGLAGMLALSACTGGGDDPGVTPEPSAPAETTKVEATPTPTPTASTLTEEDVLAALPEGARAESVAGIMHFGKWFLENYHSLMRSDREMFEAVVSGDCEFCNSVRGHYDRVSDEGAELSGGSLTVEVDLSKVGQLQDGGWGFEADVEVEDLVETDQFGSSEIADGGGPGRVTLVAEFDGHWRVTYIGAERT